MSNYIHKMLLNTRGTASIVFLVYINFEVSYLQLIFSMSNKIWTKTFIALERKYIPESFLKK